MSNAVAGVGTLFQVLQDSAYVTVAEVVSLNLSKVRDVIDITSLSSGGGYKQSIAGYRDGGTINFSLIFTREEYDEFYDEFNLDIVQDYQIVFPEDPNGEQVTLTFSGLLSELGKTIELD
jgi:predicted secreted protein